MERWIPLFDIFMNHPTPETEASIWFHQSFNSSSSNTSTPPITTISFLSLLKNPCNTIEDQSTKKVMFIQTLPSMVQSRILSFLAFEKKRFSSRDLSKFARDILSGGQEVDFWVKRAAHNLLDKLSKSNYDWISGLNLDSEEERVNEEFESVPIWLKNAVDCHGSILPWLPVSHDELDSRMVFTTGESDDEEFSSQVGENMEEDSKAEINIDANLKTFKEIGKDVHVHVALRPDILEKVHDLRARVLKFESMPKTISLANEIQQLCLERDDEAFELLSLIEPWKSDDETASILISNLLEEHKEVELHWPSQILCSVILPKLLALEKPISRVLISAVIDFCKLHQRAAEYALLFPLILRKEGINNPICEVIARIIKECLHQGHVSALLRKLLSREKDDSRFLTLPCHRHLISDELVWTESLFHLFQIMLSCSSIHLTQDSVDHLADLIRDLAEKFSTSIKFGNFLLCLVTKYAHLLMSRKDLLTETVERTNSVVTKSILSKLASL